ncbi:MAG: hypothetical protein GSR84_04540 [Desulfurococcales archaeon]|nr:hypothetical protein [Desulfurococcales archaeon]
MVEQIPLDQVSIILYFVVFALGFILGMVRRGISSNGSQPPMQQPLPPAYPPYQTYTPQPVQYTQNQPAQYQAQQNVQPSHQQPVQMQNGKDGLNSTAYMALAELSGCKKGVIVVERGRVLCVEGDEQARVVWTLERGGGHA